MKKTLPFLMTLLIACGPQQPKQPEFKDLNANGTMEPYENPELTLDERASDIVSRMTLEQKIGLVVGMGMNIPGMMTSEAADKVPGAAGYTFALENLGIPAMVLADGPAGLRILPIRDTADAKRYYCTAFPVASTLSSSWDVKLVEEVGQAMGQEVKEYGVDIFLAPALNIHRNPLGGRNFEYYSEDPVLSGKMAAAIVNGVESNGVGTSIKHFVSNNHETNRMLINVTADERALREIYLRGFEIVVKDANPWTVMSSYNKLNGVYTSQNPELLTNLLRNEWGFEGLVMTDWFAGNDAVAQMKAGNDLIMPGVAEQRESIRKAVASGDLQEAVLDRNAARILKIVLQSSAFAAYAYTDAPDLKANAAVSRKAASEGIVLLKNDQVLPMSEGQKNVAAFGIGSYEFIAGGAGSGDVNEAYTISLVQGLENISAQVDADLKGIYEKYIQEEKAKLPVKKFFFELSPPLPEMKISADLLKSKVASSDIALITLGRNSGEFQDRKLEGDYYLSDAEQQMIDQVTNAYHAAGKKVVMILNVANVVEMASWRDKVDAIVLAWQGGQEAGNALVDVLTGKVNPSGKLPTTIPMDYNDILSAKNFPGEELPDVGEVKLGMMSMGKPSHVRYEEGIYVGYRYFDSYEVPVAYPFGFGLSYSSFEYGNLEVSGDLRNGGLQVSVAVKNAGKAKGKESVQLYIAAPGESMEKPKKELRAFAKTGLLEPGESENLSFNLSLRDFSSYDKERSAWVIEPGKYVIMAAASVADSRSVAEFTIADEIIVEDVEKLLEADVELKLASRK